MSNPDSFRDSDSRFKTVPDRHLYVRIVRACHTVIEPSTWRYHLRQEAFWRLYLNGEDGAYVTTSEGTVPLRQGYLYIIPAHLQIDLRCEGPIHHFYAHFDVAGLPDIAFRELFHAPLGHLCERHHQHIIQAATADLMPERHHLGQPVTVTAQCWLKTLVYELLAHHLQSVPPEQIDYCWHLAERVKPVLPAVDLIEAQIAESLSNGHLANACSMSEGHFIRTFRDCMGQTPAQYIMERRIKSATQRLLLTTDSIEKVAEECGFGSRDYFSRIFARQTGTPPAAFRRAHFRDVY